MRNWVRKSFRNRIFVSVLLITLLPLLLCNVLMLRFQVSRSEGDQRQAGQQTLDSCRETLCGLAGEMGRVSGSLADSTVVRSVLRSRETESRILYQVLIREAGALRRFSRVDVCLPDGSCVYTTADALPTDREDPGWGALYDAGRESGLCFRPDVENAFQAAQAVRRYDGGILGYILFTVTWENLDDLFRESLGTTDDVFLLDSRWELIYGTRLAEVEERAEALRNRYLSGEDFSRDGRGECRYDILLEPETGFRMVLRQPLIFSQKVLGTFFLTSLLLGLLCLALCVVCVTWLSGNLFRPVNRLNQAMERARQGDLTVSIQTERTDEFGALAKSFNQMTVGYRQNLERSVEHQKALNQAQIRMMQAQLNPHFLYNTLDSMKWLGVTHEVPQIADIATNLAALLRATISLEDTITVEQELELVERYLEIQYIRYEDRFSCEIDVEERFQHCLVPKLILQPVVENAIIHGVADSTSGYIKITAAGREGDMILTVSDNGCGIPENILDRLNHGQTAGPGRHLGLRNVDSILRLHYGESYGIRAESEPGKGTRVMLCLPMRKKEEESYAEGAYRGR